MLVADQDSICNLDEASESDVSLVLWLALLQTPGPRPWLLSWIYILGDGKLMATTYYMDRRPHPPSIWGIYAPEAVVGSEIAISLPRMKTQQLTEGDWSHSSRLGTPARGCIYTAKGTKSQGGQ